MNMAKTRVLFVNRYFYPDESATSQLLSDLLFDLANRDYEVHVICSRQLYGQADAALPRRELVKNVAVHRVWTSRFGRKTLVGRAVDYFTFYLTCTLALLWELKRSDIVIAMTDPPLISIPAAAVSKWRGAVLINWLQDLFPEVATQLGASPLPARLDRALRGMRDASLRSAGANVVLGSRMAEYVHGRSIETQRIHIIENWADAPAVLPKAASESALRRKLGLGAQFVAGYSGNLGRAHEYETMLAAAELMRDDGSTTFLFIGGGFNMEALRKRSLERKLPRMLFLPYQPREELADSLASADVHIVSLIPSLEGLIVPSKFYGILAAGRPVLFIGDPDGELARIIISSSCGLVVRPGAGADLADALRQLRDNEEQRHAMGQTARQLLTDQYTKIRAANRWATLLCAIKPATS